MSVSFQCVLLRAVFVPSFLSLSVKIRFARAVVAVGLLLERSDIHLDEVPAILDLLELVLERV